MKNIIEYDIKTYIKTLIEKELGPFDKDKSDAPNGRELNQNGQTKPSSTAAKHMSNRRKA